MVERDVMLREMEQYVSRDQMQRHVENQQALARAALGCYSNPNSSVLEQADSWYRQQAQFVPPQVAFAPDSQVLRSSDSGKEAALREGLVCKDREGLPETWYCSTCQIGVHEVKLEEHITSMKHQQMKQLSARSPVSWGPVQPRQNMPDWMEIRNDQEFCTLCNNYVTPEHIESEKHQNRLLWNLTPQTGSTTLTVPSQPPPEWGDPEHFEWRSEHRQFYCKLCWKFADDNHISSLAHTRRLSYHVKPEVFEPSKGDPPPPPRVGHEVGREPPLAALMDLHHKTVPVVEWKQVWSKEHGKCFFYHCETQVSQWEKPHAVYNEDY